MPQSAAKQFSSIFLSYRRDDSAGHAGRLFDRLSEHFGRERLFMDVDHIEPGEDFVQVIEAAVGSSAVLLVVIGRRWLTSGDVTARRIDNPNDFVRLEVASALASNIRVIPVLVQDATMPGPQDLPDDLLSLTRRNAIELSDLRWNRDVDQLISGLERFFAKQQESQRIAEQGTEKERQREVEEARRIVEVEARRRDEEAEQKRREGKESERKQQAAEEDAARRAIEDADNAAKLKQDQHDALLRRKDEVPVPGKTVAAQHQDIAKKRWPLIATWGLIIIQIGSIVITVITNSGIPILLGLAIWPIIFLYVYLRERISSGKRGRLTGEQKELNRDE